MRSKLYQRSVAFLFVFFLTFNICKSYEPLTDSQVFDIIPSDTRVVTSLAGKWQRSYDEINWETADIPNSQEVQQKIIYKRSVRIDRELIQSHTWNLYFLGIDHQVEVFMNEQFVGKYFGGMAPFNVRIPDRMMSGETNSIKLIVSPAKNYSHQTRSQFLYAKKLYTGVIRELFLVGTPQVWISDIRYTTDFGNSLNTCKINSSIKISAGKLDKIMKHTSFRDTTGSLQRGNNFTVQTVLFDPESGDTLTYSDDQNIEIESDRTITEQITLNSEGYDLWSVQSPNLYKLKIKLKNNGKVIDQYYQPISFKKFEIRKSENSSRFYLNSKPIELKGVTYVEDYINGNQTLTAERLKQDMELMKTLGVNTIRCKFSPPHPYFVQLCNENGIMLLVELPIYDVPSTVIGMNELQVHLKNISRQLIDSYQHSPCVIGWGISDGVQEGTPQYRKFSQKMVNLFKKNSDKMIYKIIPFGSDNIETKGFDFIGLRHSRNNHSFSEINNEIKRIQNSTNYFPMFSSYGVPVQIDNRNGYSDPLSLEYQAYYINNSYRLIQENKLTGGIYNTFNDYLLESPLLTTNNENLYLATTGLFERDRQQRLSLATLQALFNKEKEPLLNVGNYTLKTPVSFIVFGLVLAIILILMINRYRRFREYLFRSFLRPYNFYADIRDQRIMSSVQTMVIGIMMAIIMGMYSTSILNYYRTSELAQFILMLIIPSDTLKEALFRIIWMPEISMLIISAVNLLLAVILSVIIRAFAILIRARIYFRDALIITIWSGVPILFLLPVAIILTRILVFAPELVVVFLILYAVVLLWSIGRILRSTAVVFDLSSGKVYFVGLLIFLILIAVPVTIYQLNYSIFAYAEYFVEVLVKL